ncbi:NADH-quinone oxidoreductase subunit M [Pseudofrankia inefficax]|uniref:Proton-translocating NADH-quinone oxidoreductase, chain M n=1 Tax=Pseudofrankia inefficax (strain DSM 45817 / CECT 9037 / DDB 130130 / EuI1c) TaxID=298654 RepID=E3J4I2_PSEI1|nr:NADH-quinone oxidoreductase subunit M [Pseudofrankia inefficax]ADP84246.1 proton-translocating NADH-quinone oxidoreductase, chain M [Pseudofrankia inefficax]
MHTAPWLTILLAIPLVGAVVVALIPKTASTFAKQLTLGLTIVELVIAVIATAAYRPNVPGFQFTQRYDWIKQFGVSYSVGADGISIVLILLAAVLVPVVVLASWHECEEGKRSVPAFFALLLALQAGMVGVFAATDVFLFYVFFEAMLIPMYFLIGSYGAPKEQTQRAYAAVKFLLYSLFGGLLMLAAVIGLYVVSVHQLGHGTFDFATLRQMKIDPTTQKWLFLGFFLAFAIKAPLFPFHTWLPDAGAQSPTGGAVLLVGVLDKVGTFGLIRYCIPLFPDAADYFAPLVLALAVIGIFYGALLAIGQRDMKRLVSYTSLAHFGFIALGCFAFTSQAGVGAVLYMVNHGLSTGLLFLVVGFLVARRGSRDVDAYGGMAKVTPVLAGVFLIGGLSSLALPGLNSFVSEFLVLVGTFTRYRALAIVATCGIVLAAIYVLNLYKRTMTGPVTQENSLLTDLSVREKLVVAPIIALIIALGVYPKPLIDIIRPSVTATFTDVGHHDPAPTTPVAGASTTGGHS